MLSVVTNPDGDVVYIHADAAGVAALEAVVAYLKEALAAEDCPHDHLRFPSWAGSELTETMLSQERENGCRQVHHVKIYGWTDEWAAKHGPQKL